MGNTPDLTTLSDEDLCRSLRRQLPERKWRLYEIVEVERRGLKVLDLDTELRDALISYRENLLAPARRQFEKVMNPMRDLIEGIAPKPDFNTKLKEIGRTSIPWPPDMTALDLPADSVVTQVQVLHETDLEIQKRVVELLKEIRDGQKNKGMFEWGNLIFGLVAAVAAVTGVAIAIIL